MKLLISVYRAWPWRPHCGGGRHVWLCSALKMSERCWWWQRDHPPLEGMSTRCYHEHHDR